MKNRFIFLKISLIAALFITPLVGFTEGENQLSKPEKSGIVFMREEEKLAHDVYIYFSNQFGIPIFRNISMSEQRHQQSMIWLMQTYGIEDTTNEEEGTFNSKELQNLYNELTSKSSTIIDALKAGAYIEEHDIDDLKKQLNTTNNADIIRVYSHLLRGSENHLRAFTRNLSFRGVTYKPEILSVEEYNSIIEQ